MNAGEWMTRATVWLALSLYAAGQVAATTRREHGPSATARWLNTAGAAVFLAHVVCAFHFYHDWSHAEAYADTARQTAEMTGWRSGFGLYVNYAFALAWQGEVVWSWADPAGYRQRPRGMTWAVRGFFLFMILNGAVLFARGEIKWFGALLCLTLLVCWWPRRSRIAHQ